MSQLPAGMANPAAALVLLQAEQARIAQQRASIIQQQQGPGAMGSPAAGNAVAAAAAAVALQEQQQQQQQQQAVANAARASMILNAAAVGAPGAAAGMNPFLQQLQQQAQLAALAQFNAVSSMVATAKLANTKTKNKDSNSTLVVRTSVPKFNAAGGVYTVAQWARKSVEDNLEFLVKLSRRADPKATAVMLTYGDGGETQTLVLFDNQINKVPKNIKKIPQISVGVTSSFADDKTNEAKMAASGVLQPTDSMWEHLRSEQMLDAASTGGGSSSSKGPKVMFLHTQVVPYQEGLDGSRRVLQVKTEGKKGKPFVATSFSPNPVFEQQVLEKWASQTGGSVAARAPPMAPPQIMMAPFQAAVAAAAMPGVAAPAPAAATNVVAEEDDYDTLISFNPRELMILERAFDDRLRKMDLKASVKKWTEEDKIACQSVIARANGEFKYYKGRGRIVPTAASKKRKSPPSAVEKDGAKDKAPAKAAASAASPAKKQKAEAKSTKATKADEKKKATPAKAATKKDTAASAKKKVAEKASPAKKKAAEKTSATKTAKETPAAKKKTPPAKKETPKPKKTPTKKETPAPKKTPAKKETPAPKKKASPTKKVSTAAAKATPKTKKETPAPKKKASPTKKASPKSKAKSPVKAKGSSKKAPAPTARRSSLRSVGPAGGKTRSRSKSRK